MADLLKPLREALIYGDVYEKLWLGLHDYGVLDASNNFIWRCPTHHILKLYRSLVRADHFDIGTDAGFYLDKCEFGFKLPRITIADPDPDPTILQKAAERLKRYQPTTVKLNLLEPIALKPASFGSISLNYVLHTLPGTMEDKSVVFQNLKPLLKRNGTLFGSTILGKGVRHSLAAQSLLAYLNAQGIFTNANDDLESLKAALDEHFTRFDVFTKGSVAIFIAHV